MPAISKSGFAATKAFQASKPGPGERPTPMPVFMTMSRSMRSGYSIGNVSPSSPPQSCTTSVTRVRSSASMKRISMPRWKLNVYTASSTGLSERPKPKRSGATTRWPAAVNTGIIFRYR